MLQYGGYSEYACLLGRRLVPKMFSFVAHLFKLKENYIFL
jgi:hypothetical protein